MLSRCARLVRREMIDSVTEFASAKPSGREGKTRFEVEFRDVASAARARELLHNEPIDGGNDTMLVSPGGLYALTHDDTGGNTTVKISWAAKAASGSGVVFFRTVVGAQTAMANACRVGPLAGVAMTASKDLTVAMGGDAPSLLLLPSTSALPAAADKRKANREGLLCFRQRVCSLKARMTRFFVRGSVVWRAAATLATNVRRNDVAPVLCPVRSGVRRARFALHHQDGDDA